MGRRKNGRKEAEPLSGEEVTLVRARDILGELANRVEFGRERIVVTRRAKKAFALVPIADYERLTAA